MSTQDRDELIQELKQLKQQLQTKWPVESLALFGSWVRGDARPDSDVDLLIQFRPGQATGIGLFEFFDIPVFLAQGLGRKVDLVEKQALKPSLAKHILPEALEL